MQAVKPPRTRSERWLRAGLCAYFSYHIAAIAIANVPATSALGRLCHAVVDPYLGTFGLWQSWDMFTTVPHYVHIDGLLVARDDSGNESRHGALLPGLEDYRDELRIHALFMRMTVAAPSGIRRDAYLEAACRAIAERGGSPATVAIELEVEQFRSLDAMRTDGMVGEFQTLHFGERSCR
jgi:hypothetical protein